ncbi:type IV secretion system DNA-binding domain-containing protein [Candidatus Nomurabacteria bacterium]|nr:MAG: type IV secretion system DNA-binding domain-containing protein [Candidatus Nomurabacteria bacterium]
MENDDRTTYFAETDYRNKRTKFGIKAKDRTRHMYVIGKTGMGKSTLLENMAIQDIQNGEGLAFIDPHGGTAEKLLDYIPEHRIKDVVYLAPFDLEYPIAFNILEDPGPDRRHLVVNGLMSTFEKIWEDAWSARMAYILQNTLYALLEYPGATLLGVNRMLTDKVFRKQVVDNVTDTQVKSFWVDEFAKYTDRYAAEATPAIQNKIGQFLSNPLIRNMVGQSHSTFDMRKLMDEKKILIVNLSKGRVGEGNANLLGGMLITRIYLAAMSRADLPAERLQALPNFYFYVDEFQSFANKTFADILSEARKYKLALTIAHQYVEQMEEEVKEAVFGNVGSMIVFRVGATDAEAFEKEFAPAFTMEDIVNLGFAQIYLRLMINGIGSKPFSAVGLMPASAPTQSFKDQVIESSRSIFANPRANAEEEIRALSTPIEPERPKREWKEERENNPAPQADLPPKAPFREAQRPVPRSYPPTDTRPTYSRPQQTAGVPRTVPPTPQVNIPPRQPAMPPSYPKPEAAKNTPKVEPVLPAAKTTKPFQGLKDILKELEKPDSEGILTTAPLPPQSPVLTPQVQQPISLATLKKSPFSPKEATPEHRSALQSVLAQALKQTQGEKSQSLPSPQPHVETEKPVHDSLPNQAQTVSPGTIKPKEVPEDVLRKILE